ncbi:MAG: hypothetical protein JO127_14135 [Caulobacteraceae bacterium]|nr:hypothetical protein [Caulobacteraceae bacterium]
MHPKRFWPALAGAAALVAGQAAGQGPGLPPPGAVVAAPGWIPAAPMIPAGAPPAGPAVGGPAHGLIAGMGEVFEVVPLKYADVSEVVGLLTGDASLKPNDNFTPQEPNFGSSGGGQGYYGGGGLPQSPLAAGYSPGGAPSESLGQTANDMIGVDRRLNAVILKGPPEVVAALKAQIAKLDRPVTSVVLETVFVELTQTGARNLGLDLNNANNQIASGAWVYSSGFPGVTETPFPGGFTGSAQAALYAQIAKGEGRIISKPRIAAQSGQTAKIVTGDALPILTSIAISGVNAVQQQVQYVNVGVTLQIAPRVTEDGVVTSHVFAVVSSVTGFSQGYPTISQREASTSATVKDGESFVIGGLTQETSLSQHTKLPVLGDVPPLSLLFDNVHASKTKTELYVVITPHVVRGGQAAAPVPPGGR